MIKQNEWYYFGPHERAGHYLWLPDRGTVPIYGHPLGRFDGALCAPATDGPYRAAWAELSGAGYCALAWWDYSVDKRPGSNSIVFKRGSLLQPSLLLVQARAKFPWVFERMPEVTLHPCCPEM